MHIKIVLLGGTAATVNALLAAASGANICTLELSPEAGDMDGLTVATGNAVSTNTGTGTPAPMPMPVAPGGAVLTPPAPMPNTLPASTEDEEGIASDGTGFDADGLPWDERIHSSSRKQGKDGKWNKRRNGPSGEALAAIEAELRSAGGPVPVPVPMPLPVAAPLAPVPMPLPEAVAAPQPVPMPMPVPMPQPVAEPAPVPMPEPVAAPAPMPMPVATPQPVAAAEPTTWDFASFMGVLGPKMGDAAGQIDAAYLAVVCAHYGLGSITDLAPKPEMIPQIIAQFTADGRW